MGNLAHSMNTPHSALFSNPQSNLLVSQADIYTNARMPGAMNTFGQTTDFPRSTVDVVSGMQMSEAEFEEIISKNKNLSTNAISKALNDATTGNLFYFYFFLLNFLYKNLHFTIFRGLYFCS